jgi:short-subunit dehydrogenase
MKTFLSIGSGPGIGIATAARFATEGFNVVLSSRTPGKLEAFADEFRKAGKSCETMQVDASDAESIQSLIATVLARHGSIDVLHYNAASLRQANIADQPAGSFLSDLSVNIAGAMLAIQAVAPSMLGNKQGTLLLTGGRFAITPQAAYISLSIGKAGIRALALGLFDEFKRGGVHVGTVTVSASSGNSVAWSKGVAEAFWQLHNAAPEAWLPELVYP